MIKIIRKLTALITAFTMSTILLPYYSINKISAYDYLSYGIDVSKFQGSIDWNSVSDCIDFAIIRAGTTSINGENYSQDSYFESNYTNAKNEGLKVGAYYYCGAYSESGFEQTTYEFLNTIKGKTFDYPVYIDIEQASKQKELGKETLTTYILSSLSIIQNAGYTAGVYANRDWFNNYIDISRIKEAGYEIWLAQYPSGSYAVDPTEYDKSPDCGIWQYSSLGSINGISGNVDVDVSYIDYSNENPDPNPVEKKYSTGNYIVNTSSGVKVRSAANTSSSVLCAAPNGTSFYVEKTDGDWGYTSSISGYAGDTLTTKSGWVCLNYCSYNSTIPASYNTGHYRVNTSSGVKVRSAADTDSSVLCAAPDGTYFDVVKISDTWGYTENIQGWVGDNLTSKEGWVSLKYCEYLGSSETITTIPTESTVTTVAAVSTTEKNDRTPVVLPKELTINVGDTASLVVLNCDDSDNITWISSNKNIATVEKGNVYAVSAGETTIYAVMNNTYCEIKIVVEDVSSEEPLSGDINGDKSITVTDAIILQKYLLGVNEITKDMIDISDMNKDGIVNVFDMITLKRIIISL